MGADSIPDDVRELILRHIDSIAQLEALLLLRHEAGVGWDASAVAKRLYIAPQIAEEILLRLTSDGFLINDGGRFEYQCRSPDLQHMVDKLAHTYASQLIPVTHLIHGRPSRIREFAEAFKLRKDQ